MEVENMEGVERNWDADQNRGILVCCRDWSKRKSLAIGEDLLIMLFHVEKNSCHCNKELCDDDDV